MARDRPLRLPPPFLKSVRLDHRRVPSADAYPFSLPFLQEDEFEFLFESDLTIFVGENGTGKSTFLEALGGLVGFDEAGGGVGYRVVDHTHALDRSGLSLADALRATWLPKVSRGWFFRAESFFSVARGLDLAAKEAGEVGPDFLSHSHGEGFMRFFEERLNRPGVYLFDEPESALSPARQLEFIKVLKRVRATQQAQIVMATHSPLLMALPNAQLVQFTPYGLQSCRVEDTSHYRLMREFCLDPHGFIELMTD